MTALIETTGLSLHFGGIVAVRGLDFAVQEGELVGMIGPNGSGKTTTINMLTGHLTPAAGQILLRGIRVEGMPAESFAARGVGRTFQVTQLFSRMTVLENMLVPGLARRHSTHAAARRQARLHL
ncbi:MAG: ATP-binding cassette domain-containing protein, partial [Acetobacteraceae bacterium]